MRNIQTENKTMENVTTEILENDFTTLQVMDWPMVQEYLQRCKYEESNHNIINMIMWLQTYPLFYYKREEYLLLLGIHEGCFFMYMPLCEKQYIAEAIKKGKEIFDHYGHDFTLSCFTKEMVDEVIKLYPEYTAIHESWADDYVYDGERLRTYAGKKMQKKRNHLNAFYKDFEGRWSYETLDETNIDDCIGYLKDWKSEDPDDFLQSERIGTFRILDLYGELPCKGGLIRIDGKVRAFAIGSMLSDRMCQENIEKADGDVRGLYQCIMKEMLSHEFPGIELVNREDDTGRENLRAAKLSYHPVSIIEKYRIKKGVES
ncbi:MAG: DUF2156 domain-containing protein [Solobacterium sp.]|nr:DUF2156 domain-containing protein [Solobacterium sp.]